MTSRVTLTLTYEQAWDLERVLHVLCPCNGGRLPPGTDRVSLHVLCDALELAINHASTHRPRRELAS